MATRRTPPVALAEPLARVAGGTRRDGTSPTAGATVPVGDATGRDLQHRCPSRRGAEPFAHG